MLKKSLYPKTQRISKNSGIVITEKLDGSNVGFFSMDDELWIATRNNIFALPELEEAKPKLYKGMYEWLNEHGKPLLESLHPDAGFFGEWIGMGQIGYADFDKKVYMFAKANITSDFEVENIVYKRENFIYPFVDMEVPDFIGIVPTVVDDLKELPDIDTLNELYSSYTGLVDRKVEGFIVIYNNSIKKYVRMKNGKLADHKEGI